MVFSENKSSGGRYRKVRNSGYYDIVTFVSGIILIVAAILIFINKKHFDKAFTVVFLCSACMNICMGIKYYKRSEIFRMTALFIAGVFMLILGIISIPALWF